MWLYCESWRVYIFEAEADKLTTYSQENPLARVTNKANFIVTRDSSDCALHGMCGLEIDL